MPGPVESGAPVLSGPDGVVLPPERFQASFACRPEHTPIWQTEVLHARADEPWLCEVRMNDARGWVWEVRDADDQLLMLRDAANPLWFAAPDAGLYRVVLRTWQPDGRRLPARAELRVSEREPFEVELVWYPSTAWGREFPWSRSAPLDLHVFGVNGWGECWDSPRYDCHAGSKEPDFGTSSEFVTRWRRGLEDGDGFGPVTAAAPGEPLPGHYLIGVHHLGEPATGSSAVAEITVRTGGKILAVLESPVLQGGEFWLAGRLAISQSDSAVAAPVLVLDEVYSSIKQAPCE